MGAKSKGRIPRNKKKSWRKQVDIAEVEEYLDDVRLQERHGGLVSEKADSEMFFLDGPETAAAAAAVTEESPAPARSADPAATAASRPARRAKVDQQNLRCFKNLHGLPGAKVAHNRNCIKSRTPAFVKQKKETKQRQAAARAATVNTAKAAATAAQRSKRTDPWASDDEGEAVAAAADEWAAAGVANRRHVRLDGPVRRPLYMRVKTSLLPAVPLPHAGQSYHPEATDHAQLLEKAAAVEHRKEADRQRWERQTTAKFPAARPTQEDWLRDMGGGIGAEDAGSEPEEAGAPPVRPVPKPKTRQQRRKLAERRAAERLRLTEKATRVMENDVFRVRTLTRELRERAAVTARRQARRLQRQQARAEQPLTLGRQPFQPAPTELSLPAELPGSLRALQAEGCPFEERLHSLQRRNIIEPRSRTTQKKKYKRKKFPRVTTSDREPSKLKTERNF